MTGVFISSDLFMISVFASSSKSLSSVYLYRREIHRLMEMHILMPKSRQSCTSRRILLYGNSWQTLSTPRKKFKIENKTGRIALVSLFSARA